MEQRSARGWKFYLGVALFVYSLATLALLALIPFLFTATVAATLVTAVVVSGELSFWVGAALLGKPFVEALKTKIRGFFGRPVVPPRPVSRRRHAVGLVLFSLSFVTYYLAMAIPFLEWEKPTELTAMIVVGIAGEVLFFTSLFVLGGEFWERLKALYRWPEPSPKASAEE